MRVLVACESSGVVRDQFLRRGHDAWSCDVLPSVVGGPHLKCDVRFILGRNWDLMIAHPPCTYLASSGLHWNKRRAGRSHQTEQSIKFVGYLMNAPIPRICIENPVGRISTRIRQPDQYIHPYEFGHPHSKRTGLWLKRLPPLQPTRVLKVPSCGVWDNQTLSGQNVLGPSEDRWRIRSETYVGIAKAMAMQWGR